MQVSEGKNTSTPSTAQGGPGPATGPVTASATSSGQDGQVGGGGCMLLDSSYSSPSAAWIWLTVLGATAIAAGRRKRSI